MRAMPLLAHSLGRRGKEIGGRRYMAVCHDEDAGDTPTGRQSQRPRESSGPLCSLSPSFHEEGLRSLSIRDLSRFLPCSLLSLSLSLSLVSFPPLAFSPRQSISISYLSNGGGIERCRECFSESERGSRTLRRGLRSVSHTLESCVLFFSLS